MGVATTHYVVLGVAITEEAQIKEFIHSSEEHLEFMDGYYDNGYREEITPNESGIHVIVDGMSGKYIVVGKILAKGWGLLNKNLEKSGETSRKNESKTTILERNDHVEPKNR